jgi:hypothetical protein
MRRSSGARRRWLERSEVFFPYFAARVRFDTSRASAILAPMGVRPAPLASYFDHLIDYAEQVDWGRRPANEPPPDVAAGASDAAPVAAVTGRPATV